MPDDLRDLIAAAAHERIRFWQRQGYVVDGIDDADIADAILAALDAAGYTIVKRDTIATALAYGDEFRTIPAAVARHKLRTAAGMPTKRQRQQTSTTPQPRQHSRW